MMPVPRDRPSRAHAALLADGAGSAAPAAPEARRVDMAGRSAAARALRLIQASYDAAQTGRENTRHWAGADALNADASNDPAVRRILRNRARYETANNTYARGISGTLADYIIGTGPRLQLLTDDKAANRRVEELFAEWVCETRLCEKLRTMRRSQIESGEVFGVFATNPRMEGPVQLDVRVIEADQIATPYMAAQALLGPRDVDGIRFDTFGNPIEYHLLDRHPGATGAIGGLSFGHRELDASQVIHMFRADRPGQSRGIPEITAALPLFAMLRRYTLATLSSAENAAALGGVLQTDAVADSVAEVDPLEEFEIERGTWLTLPEGWKVSQLDAKQPVEGYGAFKKEILSEIGRVLDMPFNLVAANSSDHNYASGRLDHQSFHRRVRIEQSVLEINVLRRVFRAWLAEAALGSGLLPQAFRSRSVPKHVWYWDGLEHVDPVKEANAQGIRIANGVSTLADECAASGKDWERVLEQRGLEIREMKRLGIPLPLSVASAAQAEAAATNDGGGKQ